MFGRNEIECAPVARENIPELESGSARQSSGSVAFGIHCMLVTGTTDKLIQAKQPDQSLVSPYLKPEEEIPVTLLLHLD